MAVDPVEAILGGANAAAEYYKRRHEESELDKPVDQGVADAVLAALGHKSLLPPQGGAQGGVQEEEPDEPISRWEGAGQEGAGQDKSALLPAPRGGGGGEYTSGYSAPARPAKPVLSRRALQQLVSAAPLLRSSSEITPDLRRQLVQMKIDADKALEVQKEGGREKLQKSSLGQRETESLRKHQEAADRLAARVKEYERRGEPDTPQSKLERELLRDMTATIDGINTLANVPEASGHVAFLKERLDKLRQQADAATREKAARLPTTSKGRSATVQQGFQGALPEKPGEPESTKLLRGGGAKLPLINPQGKKVWYDPTTGEETPR